MFSLNKLHFVFLYLAEISDQYWLKFQDLDQYVYSFQDPDWFQYQDQDLDLELDLQW